MRKRGEAGQDKLSKFRGTRLVPRVRTGAATLAVASVFALPLPAEPAVADVNLAKAKSARAQPQPVKSAENEKAENRRLDRLLTRSDALQREVAEVKDGQTDKLLNTLLPPGAAFIVGLLAFLGVRGQVKSSQRTSENQQAQATTVERYKAALAFMEDFESLNKEATERLNKLRGKALDAGSKKDELQSAADEAGSSVLRIEALAARLQTFGVDVALLWDYIENASNFIGVARGSGDPVAIEDSWQKLRDASKLLTASLGRVGEGLRARISELEGTRIPRGNTSSVPS
jgi:hypothetical protein